MSAPVLTFDDAKHEYRLDGIVIPGVHDLLRAVPGYILQPDYSQVPQDRLEYAAARGRYVEGACRALDENDLDWDALHEEAVPYVRAWEALKAKEGIAPRWYQPGEHLWHATLRYAGTPDLDGTRKGRRGVYDVKCTRELHAGYGVQLALYAAMLAPDDPGSLERGVIWLRPDGGELVVYDRADDFDAASAALACWQAQQTVQAWQAARQKPRRKKSEAA